MIQECKACEELLVEYIQAGNDVIDCREGADRRRARDLMAEALRRKARVARSLRRHRKEHGIVAMQAG